MRGSCVQRVRMRKGGRGSCVLGCREASVVMAPASWRALDLIAGEMRAQRPPCLVAASLRFSAVSALHQYNSSRSVPSTLGRK